METQWYVSQSFSTLKALICLFKFERLVSRFKAICKPHCCKVDIINLWILLSVICMTTAAPFFSGGVVNLRDIKAKVAEYNVQLDNLCQV